jgi:hypothetical protein
VSGESAEKPKSGRGGKRPGAGRKKKVFVPPSIVTDVEFARLIAEPPPAEIDAVAQGEANEAIAALVKQLVFGTSEAAKIAAAIIILDRGYGKPAVEIGGDAMLPLQMPPGYEVQVSVSADIRSEARKFALLSIEVLKRVRDRGLSESARVAAGRALLDRGLGTVGKARMPDEQRERPLGKKEEAARAAKTAASGRYATPPPPRAATDSLQ